MTFIYNLDQEGQGYISSDAGSDASAFKVESGVASEAAVEVGRTVAGSPTIGALRFNGTSAASAAIMEFKGGFISVTSILLGDGSAADYAIPVSINGAVRYIPLVVAADLQGGATY